MNNLTSSFDVASGSRSTYGVSLSVTNSGSGRVLTVSLPATTVTISPAG